MDPGESSDDFCGPLRLLGAILPGAKGRCAIHIAFRSCSKWQATRRGVTRGLRQTIRGSTLSSRQRCRAKTCYMTRDVALTRTRARSAFLYQASFNKVYQVCFGNLRHWAGDAYQMTRKIAHLALVQRLR